MKVNLFLNDQFISVAYQSQVEKGSATEGERRAVGASGGEEREAEQVEAGEVGEDREDEVLLQE